MSRYLLALLVGVAACSASSSLSIPKIDPEAPACASPPPPGAGWSVADGYCRDLGAAGVTLVDWDGQLANPAIAITITPPAGMTYPVSLEISSDEPRIYFDRGSRTQTTRNPYNPPADRHTFDDATPVVFRLAIWPDRDGDDETHTLHLVGGSVATDITVHVIDQDTQTATSYPVTVDFSADASQFLAGDPAKQAVIRQAAADWAYFFDGTGLDPVAAGAETTTVDGSAGWPGPAMMVTNAAPYTGFDLYAVGVHTSEIRSTGFPADDGAYETRDGEPIPGNLARSGALEVETEGNYATTGYYVSGADEDWYLYDNIAGSAPTDFASIVHHEMGHAIAFCGPTFENYPVGTGDPTELADAGYDGDTWGTLTSDAIVAYAGGGLPVDFRNHLAMVQNEGAIDPASGLGAFGNEYADNGVMPARRWIITKLDLLAAQAVGYPLRTSLSPFVALAIGEVTLPTGAVGAPYAGSLTAVGGVPANYWTVASGALPPGLALDSFTGAITGTPTAAGSYAAAIELADSLGAATPPQTIAITISDAATSPG